MQEHGASLAHFGLGGAVSNWHWLDMYACTFKTNRARKSGGAIHSRGGAQFIKYPGFLDMHACVITNNIADNEGGGLHTSGQVLLRTSVLNGNAAPKGTNIYLSSSASVQYVLPAPAGHWVPATKCKVWRRECDEGNGACKDAEDACLMDSTDNVDTCRGNEQGSKCMLATASQPCDWRKNPDLLGVTVYVLPLGAHDDALPTACSAGLLGGNGSDPQEQSSAVCAGACPAGFYCGTEATVEPTVCPKGHYCPEATSSPLPCNDGMYSNATGLKTIEQCIPANPGFYATTGSTKQSPCGLGTVMPDSGRGACILCDAGTFQNEMGQTECKMCEPGSYCAEGASSPIPCEKGTFSNATGLKTHSQCSVCPPGFFCSTGVTQATPCSPGSLAPEPRAAFCDPCSAGTYQPAYAATSCKVCPLLGYCEEGAAGPSSCEDGTFGHTTGLQSRAECAPCKVGGYCMSGSFFPCSTGSFNPNADTSDAAACLSCEAHFKVDNLVTLELEASSPEQCVCAASYYDEATREEQRTCRRCDASMQCTRGGLSLATVPLRLSYWRHTNRTAAVYDCDTVGDFSPCLGGEWNGTSDGYCAHGHEGPLCKWCTDPTSYYESLSASCQDCNNIGLYAAKQLGIVLAVALLLGLLRLALLRAPQLLARISRKLAQVTIAVQQFGLQAKFKCVLTFCQVWAVRETVYGFELKGDLSAIVALFEALSFDIGSFRLPEHGSNPALAHKHNYN